jgi:outer membrane lipoprotein-sorting protein
LGFIRDAEKVTVLPEQTIDGKRVYVISVQCKRKGSLFLYYFLQDDGAVIKTEEYLSDSKTTGVPGRWIRHEYKNIKFDIDIDPECFVFEPPEGVEVIDMTGYTESAGGPQRR